MTDRFDSHDVAISQQALSEDPEKTHQVRLFENK